MEKLTVQICLMKIAAVKHVSIKELVHITLTYVAQPPSRMHDRVVTVRHLSTACLHLNYANCETRL